MRQQATGRSYGRERFGCFLVWILALVGVLLAAMPEARATQPPRRHEIAELKARGEFEKRARFVKALGNDKMSPLLVRRFKQKRQEIRKQMLESRGMVVESDAAPADAGLSPSGGIDSSGYLPPADETKGLPTEGNPKVFALLISFNDYPHTIAADTIDTMLWGEGNPDHYPRESLTNYYDRSSYGGLDLSGGYTFAWYQTAYDRSQVLDGYTEVNDYLARQALIREALEYFDALGHDFSQYDGDGDGDIDYFVVFWTGPDEGWGSFWWAYQTSWSNQSYKLDGKSLGVYSWQWESDHPSVVIHETGHALGLPDYYDYDEDVGTDGGVGGFDVMDANKGDHNCFSKWLLGWVTPTVISDGSQAVTLGDTTTTNCVLIWPGIGLDDMFSEFFMVQNRQKTGNDASYNFTADGLAIWHVDATLKLDGSYFAYNNSDTEHKLLRLMEADGLEEIETVGYADKDDLYGATDQFSPDSFPASTRYNGYPSCVRVWDIVDHGVSPGAAITATFNFACSCNDDPPPGEAIMPAAGATDVSTTPTLNWTWVADSTSYRVQVCEDPDCSRVVASAATTANYWNVYPPLGDWKDYWWRVSTNGNCNAGAWSAAWNFKTLCAAPPVDVPQRLQPADGAVDTAFDPELVWEWETGADYYNIYVCSDPQCDTVIRAGMVIYDAYIAALYPKGFWAITPDLDPGTPYWWTIRSANKCQYSDWGETWSFTTHPVFAAPGLISPFNGALHQPLAPTFVWEPVPGAEQYRILVCADDDCSDILSNYLPTDPQWTFVGSLDQGTTYYWRVLAMGDGTTGQGPASPTWSFETCLAPEPPPAASLWPVSGAAEVSPGVTLRWDLPPGNEFPDYDLEVCTDSTCSDVIRAVHLASRQWAVTPGLALGTTYHWRVRTTNACGESPWVGASFTTSACPVPPEIPSLAEPAFGQSDVSVTPTLEWTYWLHPVWYGGNVDICGDAQCDTVIRSAMVNASSWTVSPALEADTPYWWRVSYRNACGPGLWSGISSFRTVACAAPVAPSLADPGDAAAVGEIYTVTWSPVDGASSYKIQESTSPTFEKTLSTTTLTFTVSDTTRAFSHTDAGCGGKTFYYRVKAQSDCSTGDWSATVDMTVNGTPAPAVPVPAGVPDNSTTPTLDWNDVPGADSYTVRVCDGKLDCYPPVVQTTTTQSQWQVTPALAVGTYWWQVRSQNDCGDVSGWSTAQEIQPGCSRPDRPVVSDPGVSTMPGIAYDIEWAAVAGATSYGIQEDTHPDFPRPTSYVVERDTFRTFSHFNTGCQAVTYYYRVVAINACGVSNVSSTVDMAVTGQKLPTAPVLIGPADAAVDVSTTPVLDWADATTADAYEVWVCPDSACTTVIRHATVTASTWTVTPALAEGTAYWWQVMVRNECGADVSPRWGFKTVCPLPGIPVATDPGTAVASDELYRLSWMGIHGAREYHIQEATNPSFSGARLLRTTATFRDFSHANEGCATVTYYYRVRAVSDCGEGTYSPPVDMVVDPLDTDDDGVCDLRDNCPDTANANQQDTDDDGVGDRCDACPFDFDRDGDMDGSDLADFAADDNGGSLADVGANYGKACR